jgi:hypothetical protein
LSGASAIYGAGVFLALRIKNIAVANSATAASTPTMIPTIAPVEMPDDFPVLSCPGADLDDVVEDVGADIDVEAPDAVATDAELTEPEDSFPPRTCASSTTSLVLQQSVFSPQHHRSLSAFPLQGVRRTFPEGYLCGHTLMQFLLATFWSVQKSTQNLSYFVSI